MKDLDAARLTFIYPAHTTSFENPSIQFGLVIDVPDEFPKTLADKIIQSLMTTDPKSTAEMIGATKEAAERLGLIYRKPSGW
ncbi:MAG TPA: hypothetical protein VLL08_03975 [Kineosporiaceae bacterium]|nr:hypothetical protein [Kineosporiaceae bacterium]